MRVSTALVLTWIVSATTWAAPPLPKYAVIEIPPLGTDYQMSATGLNNRGDVVGTGTNGSASKAFAYQHSSGVVNELTFGTNEGNSYADAIGNNGLIVGTAQFQSAMPFEAFLWSMVGGAEALPGIGVSWEAAAVSSSMIIAGYGGAPGFPGQWAIVWTGPEHSLAFLPSLRCDFCSRYYGLAPSAVNDQGHIVGESPFALYDNGVFVSAGDHAVEWQRDPTTSSWEVKDLGALGGASHSYAEAINNTNDVVGASDVGPDSGSQPPQHAFLYHRGTMIDLGTLPGDTDGSAASINDRGQIVGWSGPDFEPDAESQAFIYLNGHVYNLNDLTDPANAPEGLHLEAAVGINSAGWIAANGTRDGEEHAYLLVPVR